MAALGRPGVEAVSIARNLIGRHAADVEVGLDRGPHMRLEDARRIMRRYHDNARMVAERETEDNRAFERRREMNLLPLWRSKYLHAPKVRSCQLRELQRSGLFGKWKIAKPKSQAKTERMNSLMDPDVAATRARSICLESLRATEWVQHANNDLEAPPKPPLFLIPRSIRNRMPS